ncbi:DNA repair protein RecN [Angustibacter sp. McL0619]|uniref:DNA repair protein RecN n=1 Tax=Angustibacter sp. McL0619 TaxID=3415676 RepID=UPI003CF5F4DA
MRIRGLGVITDAVLELGPGLTVVTGETGAGKTMVVTGLGLLLGGRADSGAVRADAAQAVVEGRVLVDPSGPVAKAAQDAGAELDDNVLLLARTVTAAGRSRAHAGGRAVPVNVLAEIASELVTVHGQSDQLRLLQPARQRETLDRFAGTRALVTEHSQLHAGLREVERQLEDVVTHARERAHEAAQLRQGLEEIEAVDPQSGEDHQLRDEDARLGHADALRLAAEQAHAALTADGAASAGETGDGPATGASELLGAARHAIDPVRDHDPALAEIGRRLSELGFLVADLAADLASYVAGIESDPARLAVVQQRRAELGALVRRYGQDGPGAGELSPDVAAVLAWGQRASKRLLELDDDGDRVEQLRTRRAELRARLGELAGRLHLERSAAARRLADQVAVELAQLAMPNARLEVLLTQRDDPDGIIVQLDGAPRTVAVAAHGVDDVELQLSPHAGAELRPVAKGASGGELSRVMLALEVVLAGADPVPTFVFDEVDAGVGGRAAIEIGRRLAALARSAQVIVVTHLPQVAAYADRHLLVLKADDGAVTESGVRLLDDEARVAELARMLAGHEESGTARAHAKELRETAAAEVANASS